MSVLKLLSAFFKVNLQMSLAYRADAIINILMNIIWLGWDFLSLSIIFSNTDTLGGWGPGELIALLGVFRIINTLFFALIFPNTEKFNTSIRDGSMDYMLLQPVNSLFLVTFSRMSILRIGDLLIGIALVVVGIGMTGGAAITLSNLLVFLLLTASGLVVIYSLWIILISLTFWFIKFDNNITLLHALLDAGRYPAHVYPFWLRALITFIVPVAVATTVPLQGLRGDLHLGMILLYLAIAVAIFLVAKRVWRAGVRRYNGASS